MVVNQFAALLWESYLELLGESTGILPGEHQLSAEIANSFP